MPLSEKQREALKSMTDEERAELLEAIGSKSEDSGLSKTVELLQGKIDKLEKALSRKGNEERRRVAGGASWFERVFGG